MKEINYQFRERFSVVHKDNRRDFDKACPDGFISVDSSYSIVIPASADRIMVNAARDLEDYFFTSMKISVKVLRDGEACCGGRIIYSTDATMKDNTYRVCVKAGEILLIGKDSRMAAQAGYFLEDLMNLEEGPYLEAQDTVRESLFNPRMVHSGYGLDMYPDEHLINIAHSGISSILVFITGIDKTPHGYHDFNDLCYRAAGYGISVYAYSYLANRMHPCDEGAEAFYEDLYGSFFDRCPHFKGIIFVGESCEFPSREKNSAGIRRRDNMKDGKYLREYDKPYPGWWPCYDYKDLMELISRIIRKRCPDFDIVLWSYNWNRAPADARRALIETLPKDITLQATFEMGQTVERDGIKNRTTDYTLFVPGPGYYFSTEAEFAKENDIKLYSMTNTGGLTWDIGVVPYLPMPYQWIRRFEGMVDAHERFGLVGTMDSHHFGFSPSFISDLAKWAFHYPKVDLPDMVRRLAARDFSDEVKDEVCRAYKLLSEGIHYQISTNPDQYGPCRMGPSYPFVLFKNRDLKIPTVPYAHFGGNAITFPVYGDSYYLNFSEGLNYEETLKKHAYEIRSFKEAERRYTEACLLLRRALESVPKRKRREAEDIVGVAEFIRNTVRCAINVKEFFERKLKLLDSHGEERNKLVREMLEICRRERENAVATIPLVERDSRLGYEPSMEYMCDRAHIEWKLELLDKLIEEELPSYLE